VLENGHARWPGAAARGLSPPGGAWYDARMSGPRTLAATAALAAVLAGAPGCFLFHRGAGTGRPDAATAAGEIALHVTNHNYLDVVIYVLHDGQATRVGTVTGSSSLLLFIPARLLGIGHDLQLVGDPIGSPDFARTETLIIQPGQYIEWTLETDLRRSSVGVY